MERDPLVAGNILLDRLIELGEAVARRYDDDLVMTLRVVLYPR